MLSKILERNRVAADRLTDDFTNSISGTAVISNGGRTLRFTQHGGFNGSTSIAGDILRYELQADPDDPENGSDDNDNGIIDEGILVRVNETTGETVTLTASLDLGSCSFVANGTGVTVTITTIGTTATAPTSTRKITALSLTPLN